MAVAALDEKKVTVTELTAAVATGSVIISAVSGDAPTPIANQVAEMATYLLIVVGAILLTMNFLVPFQYLIPLARVLIGIWLFTNQTVLLQRLLCLAVRCLRFP